jgi:hypothetical protein
VVNLNVKSNVKSKETRHLKGYCCLERTHSTSILFLVTAEFRRGKNWRIRGMTLTGELRNLYSTHQIKIGKAIPVQAFSSPEGSSRVRHPAKIIGK